MNKFYKPKFVLAVLLFFVTSVTTMAQDLTVNGKVTDGRNADPIPGVNILVKGTTRGTVSNANGEFSIQASTDDVLIISFIGYLTEEVKVTGSSMDVSLTEDVISLEEVVVSGLATTVKRSNLGNAVATVSADELTGRTNIQTLDYGL